MRRSWGLAACAACAALLLAFAATASHAADDTDAKGAAAAPTAASINEASAPVPSLDGIWMFDAKRSDDPRKIMEANRPQGGPGGEGGRRFGGGMGGGPPGGGPPGGGEGGWGGRRGGGDGEVGEGGAGSEGRGENADGEQRPRVNPFERVMRPAQKVVIEMLEDQVNVAEDERTPRAYAIADSLKAHGHELVTEGTKAFWKGGKLQMSQVTGRRGAVLESYELSADGKTLTIRAHREGGPEGMPNPVFTRVYTRYEGD